MSTRAMPRKEAPVRAIAECDRVRIIVGTTPNDRPHVGNLLTFTQGLGEVVRLVSECGQHPEAIVAINDLDPVLGFDANNVFPVIHHADPEYAERKGQLFRFFGLLEERLGIPIRFSFFSELQWTDAFRDAIERLGRSGYAGYFPLRTLHEECGHCSPLRVENADDPSHPHETQTYLREGSLLFGCANTACADYGRWWEFDLRHTEREIHTDPFFAMPLRDHCLGIDIHLFGGDYDETTLGHLRAIGMRLGLVLRYYRAPIVMREDGTTPLSKSQGDGGSSLEELFLREDLIGDLLAVPNTDGLIRFGDYKHLIPQQKSFF